MRILPSLSTDSMMEIVPDFVEFLPLLQSVCVAALLILQMFLMQMFLPALADERFLLLADVCCVFAGFRPIDSFCFSLFWSGRP